MHFPMFIIQGTFAGTIDYLVSLSAH